MEKELYFYLISHTMGVCLLCLVCERENKCLLWSQLFPAIICFEARSNAWYQDRSNSLK